MKNPVFHIMEKVCNSVSTALTFLYRPKTALLYFPYYSYFIHHNNTTAEQHRDHQIVHNGSSCCSAA